MTRDISTLRLPFNIYYNHNGYRIITTCSTWPHIELLSEILGPKDYVIYLDWSYTADFEGEKWSRLVNTAYPQNYYFLSNEQITNNKRVHAGLNSYLINNNSWLNERLFFYRSTLNKRYGGVINSRAKHWKRLELANRLDNLALIVNRDNITHQTGLDSDAWTSLKHGYLNNKSLMRHEVAYILNLSRVGLIFSDKEGACYSSNEFLLCGLPVISTAPSTDTLGGREFWYNEYNSLLVAPDPEAVKVAYEDIIARDLDPRKIRHDCLMLMTQQRHDFVYKVLDSIFRTIRQDGGNPPSASYYFEEHYYMKGGVTWHAIQAEPHVVLLSDILNEQTTVHP
jgi:hypothetical protein